MKKFIFVLATMLVALAFSSCDDSITADKIVGKWSVQHITYTEEIGNQKTTYDMPTEGEYYEFLSDGVYTVAELKDGIIETGKWTLYGYSLHLNNTKEGTKRDCTITNCTSTKLSFKWSEIIADDGDVITYRYECDLIRVK